MTTMTLTTCTMFLHNKKQTQQRQHRSSIMLPSGRGVVVVVSSKVLHILQLLITIQHLISVGLPVVHGFNINQFPLFSTATRQYTTSKKHTSNNLQQSKKNTVLLSSTTTSLLSSSLSLPYTYEIINEAVATDQWELDCYSRPVVLENGKKLWEVLITDTNGSFRFVQEIPSNQVNSKQVRQIVDNLIELSLTSSSSNRKPPSTIRFFRGAMFNMISIALQEIDGTSKPSRCTYALSSWLEERYETVYPQMKGYNPSMVQLSFGSSSTAAGATGGANFLNVRTPVKLPDALRGEKYAFVSLPLAEFIPGTGSVSNENIGVGRLCPLPSAFSGSTNKSTNNPNEPQRNQVPGDVFVQGIVVISSRATALASWLAGTEIVSIQADLRKRIVTMETDIDTQYLMAKLNDVQRIEAAAFEEGKEALYGLHFVSVQETDDSDPTGFWLLREPPTGI